MLISRPNFWETRGFLSSILLPFSYVYYWIFKHISQNTKKYNSTCKTICIGNIAIGGSGKTPIVIETVKGLKSLGKKVCVLSRGYMGILEGPVFVDINNHSAKLVGDEPLQIAKYCSVIIAKNKIEGLKLAEKEKYEYVIFDDGLQNCNINYDYKILALQNNLGNNRIIPSGPLREYLSDSLKRVDCVIIPEELHNSPIFPLLGLKQIDIYSYNLLCHTKLSNENNYLLFSGIANPNKFFNLVIKQKVNVKKTISFPDHYMFKNKDLDQIINQAKKMDCQIVTTEKDYVRIPNEYKEYITPFHIYLDINNINSLIKCLK